VFLLDTCVISHLSPAETRPDRTIADWLRRNGEHCYLSVVTITEIAYGIAWARHRGATAKAARLQVWHEQVITLHGERILPIDGEIALRAGALLAIARAAGSAPNTEDAWIAATAELRGLCVLTFNAADFRSLGVAFTNPRTDRPPDVTV
jgi:predicted nucleic acid-binding protein